MQPDPIPDWTAELFSEFFFESTSFSSSSFRGDWRSAHGILNRIQRKFYWRKVSLENTEKFLFNVPFCIPTLWASVKRRDWACPRRDRRWAPLFPFPHFVRHAQNCKDCLPSPNPSLSSRAGSSFSDASECQHTPVPVYRNALHILPGRIIVVAHYRCVLRNNQTPTVANYYGKLSSSKIGEIDFIFF